MNILFVTKSLPYPLENGATIRTYHLIKYLSQKHDIFLISIVRGAADRASLDHLSRMCKQIVPVVVRRGVIRKCRDLVHSFTSTFPYTVLANSDPRVVDAINRVCETVEITLIQSEELYVASNIIDSKFRGPIVLDAFNIEARVLDRLAATRLPVRRMYYEWQSRFMRRYEHYISRGVDAILSVSKDEADYFKDYNSHTHLVPNGADNVELPSTPRENLILFTGVLSYPPNAEALEFFFREVWPILAKHSIDLRVAVVARHIPSKFRTFRSEQVDFLTDVDDIDPILKRARILFVPLRSGGGTRLKILQAFSRGLPVVSTSIGAEGLDVTHGTHLLVADSPEEFAEAIIKLLNKPELTNKLALNAAELIKEKYLWSEIVNECFRCYESISR